MITEDLSANLLSDESDAITIRWLAEELSMRPVNHGPTHHSLTSHACIDMILIDQNDTITVIACTVLASIAIIDVSISIHSPHQETFEHRDYKIIDTTSLSD